MSQYASLTVAQLKDALKEKNLPTDGKKAELLARLEESDPATEQSEQQPHDSAETEQPPQEEELIENDDSEIVDDVKEEIPEKEAKPEKKVLSPEERKQLAVELLTKKIQRAEKFGDEASATAAKKDLARVEKFGVDPSTALGKEIGDLSKDVNSELGNGKFKKGKKRNGRGKKVAKN
ncbi:hypothetical protein OXX59_003741 [Metschnikowia pulcherrima]